MKKYVRWIGVLTLLALLLSVGITAVYGSVEILTEIGVEIVKDAAGLDTLPFIY